MSGGSGCDWIATPVSVPTLEEEGLNPAIQRSGGNTMNSISPGLQIMVSAAVVDASKLLNVFAQIRRRCDFW